MMTIPLKTIPNQEFNIVIDDRECTIHLYQRDDHLYVDLAVGDSTVIAGEICQNLCGIATPMEATLPGVFVFVDTQGDTPPQWDGLGDRYSLLYITEADAEEMIA